MRRQTEAVSDPSATSAMRSLDRLLTILGLAATLYILITTLIVIRNCYSPIPLSDQWDEWRLFFASKTYSTFLFDQHNEHRIALARIFFYIDQYVFHARNTFLLVSISLIQAITGICLWRFTLSSGKFSRTSSVLLGCFIFSCLFSAQQFNNFTWGFQIQFVAVYCTAIGALFALARIRQATKDDGLSHKATVWLAVACFLAVLSTYSMSNGLLVWPLLLFMSLWLGLPRRHWIVLGTGMVVMSTAYLWGYHNPGQHAKPLDSMTHHLPQVLAFAATFLGSPADSPVSVLLRHLGGLSDAARVGCCAIFGFAGVVASLGCMVVLWRKRHTALPTHVGLFCVVVFVMATAFLVGLGRVNFPLTDALVSRYATPAMIFWIALASLAWRLYGPDLLESHPLPRYTIYAALLVSMAGIAVGQPQWVQFSKGYASGIADFESVVVSGVDDPDVLRAAFHTPAALFPIFDYLKDNRLSAFTEDWTHWTGTALSPHFVIDTPKSCMGSFDNATFIPSAMRPGSKVSGWGWDQKDGRAPETVILADQSGRIVGVAHNMADRDDVTAVKSLPKSAKIGWRGYITSTEANPVTAYLLESDGKSVCSLGSLTSGDRIPQAVFSELVAPIKTPVTVEGTWVTQNGYHRDAGQPPFDGPVYGSYNGSDTNTGALRVGPFRVANQTAIAVPVVSGPNNGGLLLKAVNAKTGELISALAPPPVRLHWWAWRVDLPTTQPDLTVSIVAEDNGRGFGQWQAIGMPHLLKDSTLSPLATVNRSAQEISFTDIGAAIEASPPSIEGFWTRDGYNSEAGHPPVDGAIYGSWAGSDAHTGTIRMGPFSIRGQSSIALPLVTGPSSIGMEVKIVDVASGQILALLSPPPVHVKWWAWKVKLPEDRPNMKIMVAAQDNGASWGQWQAVGVPHLLKHK